MSGLTHHLVSRGFNAANHHLRNKPNQDLTQVLATWQSVTLGFTFILFFLTWMAVRYTYGEVVATLAMVESPTATAIIRTSKLDVEDPDAPLLSPEEKKSGGLVHEEILMVKSKPITSSLRGTVRHLRSRAGWTSMFRGFQLVVFYAGIFSIFSSIFRVHPSHHFTNSLVHIGTSILLCRVQMAWTHQVISEPTGESAFSRIVGGHIARKIVGPTAVYAVLEQTVILVPVTLARFLGLEQFANNTPAFQSLSSHARHVLALKFGAVALSGLLMGIFVLFPAHVVIRRVQASLLSEEEESIVPFDRSFGGKVVPEVVGGTGRVSMRDAWTTFDWNARVRLIKVYVKMMTMEACLLVAFITIFVLQAKFIFGPQIDKAITVAVASHQRSYQQ